jgi:hypothetical protein
MRNHRAVWSALCLLALASLAGCKGCPKDEVKEPVSRGVDVFETATDPASVTSVSFAANPIPADFFCPGSPAFNGSIALRGTALDTTPPGVTANGDTIVERLEEGSFAGGSATIPVQVRALKLASIDPLSIVCPGKPPNWRLEVCACGEQPTTEIVVKVDDGDTCGCGHFDGSLKIKTCLKFVNEDNSEAPPLNQDVDLKISNTPWCPKAESAIVIANPFKVKDCQGTETELPGTGNNFFPGFTCAEQGPTDCWTKHADLTECHESGTPGHPHCINPVCGKRQD